MAPERHKPTVATISNSENCEDLSRINVQIRGSTVGNCRSTSNNAGLNSVRPVNSVIKLQSNSKLDWTPETELPPSSSRRKKQNGAQGSISAKRNEQKTVNILRSVLLTFFPNRSRPDYIINQPLYSDVVQVYDTYNDQLAERRRRGYAASKEGRKRRKCLLPWWSVFIGYALVIASITASAAFTFFYSLQWGGEVSLQWMASLFFSTTTGTFLIEPIKVRAALSLLCPIKLGFVLPVYLTLSCSFII